MYESPLFAGFSAGPEEISQGSNSHIPNRKKTFEMSRKFPHDYAKLEIGDFSARCKLQIHTRLQIPESRRSYRLETAQSAPSHMY
jgi:hypothetical protein